MYYVTCDGFPLLDWRDNDLILVSPRVKLEVNTVGEGSFTIYKYHPHYDKLKKLKSVFEVSDENGVIFRGRATGDTVDFDQGMAVDLEGAMAFFNDSVVRPFHLPDDFAENADYIAAAESGNVIEFFLGWLIDNHNSQVEDFQKMKLGNVTVSDPNNYITRSNSDYASTWATLKGKLFDSSLGGYLCIRYEADGNYIDYLEDFTEVNSQEIAFGENILDLTRATEASGTYSAIIPIGAAGLTIAGKNDGNITDDLVKSGDTIYSISAVAQYGWIYAPVSETTWEDVTDDANLLRKGGEWLANGGMLFSNGIEVTAVDLHFSDAQIESLRIYKKVNVRSAPHGLSEQFPLTCLEIELLEPQNTKITVGKTIVSLTERTAIQEEEARKKYSKLSKTDDEIRMEVVDLLKGAEARWTASVNGFSQTVEAYDAAVEGYDKQVAAFNQTVGGFNLTVEGYTKAVEGYDAAVDGYTKEVASFEQTMKGFAFEVSNGATSSSIKLMSGTMEIASAEIKLTGVVTFESLGTAPGEGTTKINGGWIDADTLYVNAAKITGTLTIGSLPEDVAMLGDIPTNLGDLNDDVGLVTASNVTTITNNAIKTASITANQITSGTLAAGSLSLTGLLTLKKGETTCGYMGVHNQKGGPVLCDAGQNNFFIATDQAAKMSYAEEYRIWVAKDGCYSNENMKVYSDKRLKKGINYDLTKEEVFFASLKPCSFQMDSDKTEKTRWGFVAQDVIESAVGAGFDSEKLAVIGSYEGMNSLAYNEFTALNTYMIQKLMNRVTELEKKYKGATS